MASIEILCIVAVILLFLYVYSSKNHDFWKTQGVKGPEPIPFLGNFKDVLLNRLAPGQLAKIFYDQFIDESMIGVYARSTPILILKDPELIKDVLIKDFNKFADRGLPLNEKIEPLSQNLLNLEPKRWRPLRKKLSPVFTSGKLREMFFLLLESGNHFETYLRKIVPKNKPIECRLLTSKFTMDVIGSCAFGIDINTLSDEENDFIRMGREIFDLDFWRSIKRKIRELAPGLFSLLGPIMKNKELDNFFTSLITDTMKFRKENNVVRHDFVDLLRYVKENPEKLDDIEMTDSLIAAQCFIFFAAGFETSSTTMSNALYELALNPSVQDKLRNEIQQVLNKSEGKLTYDNVKSMKYLHKVFQETLRKYPPATMLVRRASEKYTFSGTNVTIPKDTRVWVPVYAMHRDPKNYPNPELFDPERFEDEEINSRHAMVYLPFGEGPRNCIGARFAVFQTKIGLIKILQNYRVEDCEETPKPYVINPRAFLLAPIKGIYLKFIEICIIPQSMALIEILCIVAVILLFFYVYNSKNLDFWKNQGVKGPDPHPIFGNFKDILLNRLALGQMVKNLYDQFIDESMIGIYALSTPILIIKAPELIKDVLIKDFNIFSDRGLPVNEKIEPLSQNLLNLEPKRWRPLRKKLSPVFTSGKLREMFFLLLESGNHFETYLQKIVPKNEPIECRLLTSKFTMDVIGSCAFGIDINTLSDEENDFVRMGRKIIVLDFWRSIKGKIRDFSPGLFSLLGPIMKDEELDNFFTGLITDTIKYRKENHIVRHDFVDLLRYVKENPEKMDDVELTDTLIAAQCFIFFAAGFETSSTTMSNALYELALNPSVQDKLRNEIQQVLNKSEGKLTYDNVKSMKYLHKVFQETLRKYPPATMLVRMSSEKYTFSGTNVTIPKDTRVLIPVYAIHQDPKNYPKPELFDPERFEDKEVNSRDSMLYLPFGEGPRNCIGARFAVFQTKIGLIKILQNYHVEECEKTPMEYVIDPKAFLLTPKEGIYLKFTEIF
ncbi:uncharacterized protein LOC122504303 [Leptopilina heterotoma]|uniref:uncharacterized protein LOC122504303 n=1 Tax=Leptopilina heterotoma TaxID=63436 RepID=UPI001CA98513|nr:uncharacterized protein LOC122504303 [Leptopilina heterotoma]